MVGAGLLTADIASVAISLALPGIAWTVLFALAWRDPDFAESLGFGSRTFWLLFPGALLASFALLPVALVRSDVLAVSFAGAAFPLAVGLLSIGRLAPAFRRSLTAWLGAISAETAALLALVLLADAGDLGPAGAAGGLDLAVVLGAAAMGVVGLAILRGVAGRVDRGLEVAYLLTSGVLVLTFVGSAAIPGVGISEGFPYFLLPPMAAGAVAVLLAGWAFPGRAALALPVSFLASGWGVVLGADVLREPPLYTSGPSGLYAVGGAGVLDLVYLSCFLGLLAAWGVHRILRRPSAPVGPVPEAVASPTAKLREAYVRGTAHAFGASLLASAAAGRAAALQAHRLRGSAPTDPSRPWVGLGMPGWVVSDQANLERVARAGSTEPREAVRAFVTARALVRWASGIGRARFASLGQRLLAFGIDVAVLGAVATAVFAGIVLATPGGVDAALDSLALNAGVYAFVALSLVYFAVSEQRSGATLGKRLVGIEVRDRALGPIDGLSAFVRNTPLAPVLTLYGLGLAIGCAIALRGIATSASLVGLGLPAGTLVLLTLAAFVLAGILLVGLFGIVTIILTPEHQRVGDLWARTWVVRRVSAAALPASLPTGPVPSA